MSERATSGDDLTHFCHSCDTAVAVVVGADEEPLCKQCGEAFVELLQQPEDEKSNVTPAEDTVSVPPSTTNLRTRLSEPAVPVVASPSPNSATPLSPDPLISHLLRSFQDNERGHSGLSDVVTVLNQTLQMFQRPRSMRVQLGGSANVFGDYAFGNMDSITEMLRAFDQAHGRHGSQPAASAVVDSLERVTVTKEWLEGKEPSTRDCAVCQDAFKETQAVIPLPCNHTFHDACLLPWLVQHSTCPVCRASLATEAELTG